MTITALGSEKTAPRKTAENTGGVDSVVANHRGGGECSVVVTTLHSYIFQVSLKKFRVFVVNNESKFGHSYYFGYWLLQHLVLPHKL